ncbi:IPT/TIG domain-containing protein [Streptomyces sp. H27-D2]|uniref:IPT/TIG domain-containing protein n=1 Tax=Streptomyces sp. H27-D2 TaxID=3046304 RepID=UPI002DBC5D26|nr:IPT/TIG domain-containing protein [Streptomyces sp. H27-D2]MEC4018811.1 IPT/TIG domain-containing protein [Streptomyces sp. H27-D2]
MADYSQSPLELLLANQRKGYVGIHIEQGVPLLERDLNLLHDLIAATVRAVIARYIGNGAPAGANGFAVQALPAGQNSQDFRIAAGDGGPGTCLVGGLEVGIPAAVTYKSQPGVPALTTPTTAQPDPRADTVFLDVSLAEVDATVDTDLANSLDVGVETSVRLKPVWVVRVAEGVPVPAAPAGHTFYPLAALQRRRNQDTIDAAVLTDLRQRRLTVSDVERRLSLVEKTLLLPAFVPQPLPQFVPKSGVINQPITVNGSNLSIGTPTVRFGNLTAKVSGAASATQIVARVPGGLTPDGTPVQVKVTLANVGGAVLSDDAFTVQPAPAFADPPSPQFGPVNGTPGTQVTLNGFNFNAGAAQVQFAAVAATIVGTPTNTALVVQVPPGLVPAGSTNADVRITVTTTAGTAVSDDTFRAELNIPAPTFAVPPSPQFTPKSGVAGQTVTLNGSNFNFAPVTVKFDTAAATIVGSPSAAQIAAQVPAGLTAPGTSKPVKISVSTAGGTVTSTDTFTVNG